MIWPIGLIVFTSTAIQDGRWSTNSVNEEEEEEEEQEEDERMPPSISSFEARGKM